MCCFSRPVKSVSNTLIFARPTTKGRQVVVYSMRLDAAEALAMVLPIPVTAGTPEDGVKFINLEKYPRFFADLVRGFPSLPPPRSLALAGRSAKSKSLAVVQVGSFEASFVPTAKDFPRLDERFQLPPKTLAKLKGYTQHGFAVFKLKAGTQTVHPMAFDFPTALTDKLFFPTVHIHDGEVHEKAEFDHELYCQPTGERRLQLLDWEESHGNAGQFMDLKLAQDVVLRDEHCYRRKLHGELPNTDTLLAHQT